jgi:hypothetical protein
MVMPARCISSATEADDVGVILVRGFEDAGPWHHDAEVDDLVSVALEDDADDVLADVVDVALDRGHDNLALGAGAGELFRLDIGDEVGDGFFHDSRRFDDLRQEHLA